MSALISTSEMKSVLFGNSGITIGGRLLQTAAGGFSAFAASVKAYVACRSARTRLAALDDRLLLDIGISRKEIGVIVHGRRHQAQRRAIPQWPVI